MDLWRLCIVLLLAQLLEFCCIEAARTKRDGDLQRKTLEREILKHTVQYLRSKLLKCLRSSDGPRRAKRKSGGHLLWMLEHEVDMDVMGRTKDYLMTRIVDCRSQGSSNYGKNDKASLGAGIIKSRHHQSEADDTLSHQSRAKTMLPPTPTPEPVQTTIGPRTLSTTGNQHQEALPLKGLSEKNTDANALHPLPLLPKTTPKPVARPHTFVIDGKEVTCKHMSVSSDQTTLLCDDVWIDGKYRLPNSDLCLPRFGDKIVWRHLKHIQKNTFRVLDLEGFCQALGDATHISGFVTNLRVSWDCGENDTRIKWLNDQWAGLVVDNGYLHDLECTYDSFT